ncbi:MAG TPA: DUF6268 family outer membrane beta-barrel protein [Gemmatales bacterium]|nr:DUF6268 family outer membrane beta-barrel protein [Gemmatales bacterium]
MHNWFVLLIQCQILAHPFTLGHPPARPEQLPGSIPAAGLPSQATPGNALDFASPVNTPLVPEVIDPDVPIPKKDLGIQNMAMMGGNNAGGPGYFFQYLPEAQVKDQPSELGFLRQQLRVGAPLYKDEQNLLLLNTGVQHHLFQGSAQFPDTGRRFPDDLWNIRLGPMYLRKLEDNWLFGIITMANIASDAPFEHGRDVNANVIAFLRIPSMETNAWLFSVFYSPLSEIAFPVPGVAYQWRPNESWSISLGVPFSVNYLQESWSLDFNWMPVRNFRLQAGYQLTERTQLYGRYQWFNESWFLESREADRDRLFYYEMSLTGGVRYQLADRLFAEIGAGYAFDRYFFEGRNFDDRNRDRIDLAAGLLLQAGLNFRF